MAANGITPSPARYVHVNAIQTVTPGRSAEPAGRSRRVLLHPLRLPAALRARARVVLYYTGKEEAWTVAAWMKETMNVALPEEPLLAGRLRRLEVEAEEKGCKCCWEVKMNDCGVRMVQAAAEVSMEEFMAAEDREEREAALCYWVDVIDECPHFSALLYLQVTKFQGSGYSVGISCSLLLTDPFFLTRFLKKWSSIHNRLQTQGQLSDVPLFHLSNFTSAGRPYQLSSIPIDPPSAASSAAATILFRVSKAPTDIDALASACLNEATVRLDASPVSKFTLIVNDRSGDLKVESRESEDSRGGLTDAELKVTSWDELGAEEIAFGEGNKPVCVSYKIVVSADEALVLVAVPSEKEGGDLIVSVTVSNKV